MNDKEELIKQLIKEKGGTREQYLSLLDTIAYHESAGTMDPTLTQYGGGPGKGVYQFEEGENGGAITAAKRTKTYLESKGNKVPSWLAKATEGDDLDVSKLTKPQQDVLFLGNMRGHPKADFSKIWKGEESVSDFWANYHWAGAKEDRRERIRAFNDSTEHYNSSKQEGTSSVADITPSQHQAQQPIAQQSISQPVQKDIPQEQLMAQPVQDNIQPIQQQQVAPQLMQSQASQPMANLYDFMKQSGQKNEGELNSFDGGGTHQQNPLGGIPQGKGANGQMNTVEEGETSFDLEGDKFVFSDRLSLTDYIKKGKNTNPNQFEAGGKLNNCGGPGQPPCDNTDLSKLQILDEVNLTNKNKDSRFVKADDPRYQANQDSLGLYNKGLKDLRTGQGYESLNYYAGKPKKQYPHALGGPDESRDRLVSKEEIGKEISEYGKRDYDYVTSGKAKNRYQAYKNGEGYEDGESLHMYQMPYADKAHLFKQYVKGKEPSLVPQGQKIKPTSVVFGPESDPVSLYDKPKGQFFVEGSPEAENAKRQLILQQRGTYNGPIDGVWGKESEKAFNNTDFKSKKGKSEFQDIDFGKYKDYFKVSGMSGDTTIIENDSSNPHNAQTIKEIEKKIRKLNPGKKFKLSYKK